MVDAYERYWARLRVPMDETSQALMLVEREYKVPVGKLRPWHALHRVFAPTKGKHRYRWLHIRSYEVGSSDVLVWGVWARVKAAGHEEAWLRAGGMSRLGDVVLAYAGRPPSSRAGE